MTTFTEMKHQTQMVQASLDTISELVRTASKTSNIVELQTLRLLIEEESRVMSHESDKLTDMMRLYREELNMRNRIIQTIAVLLLSLLLFAGVLRAQDVTPEATPVATAVVSVNGGPPVEVPVVAVQPSSDSNTLYVIGFLVLAAITTLREFISNRQMGTLVTTINKALDNKYIVDEATRRYMESSLPVQELVKVAVGIAGVIGASIPGDDDLADRLKRFGEKIVSGEKPPGVG